ncbi:hypothetical protein QT508_22970 [Escherichia coli]|nr:hypothetical protein [Escherichia coli]WMW35887.1 hypothetical protein QT508_22970 [Escherichia coli]
MERWRFLPDPVRSRLPGLCGKWFLGSRFVLQPRGRYSTNGYSFHRRHRRFNRAWRGGSGCWCARSRQRR